MLMPTLSLCDEVVMGASPQQRILGQPLGAGHRLGRAASEPYQLTFRLQYMTAAMAAKLAMEPMN